MQHPKISVITPSLNQDKYIEQTISSVISQNYPNLEFIIIDGNSSDNSVEIIKKYEKHISYWISEPDKGQTHAINKGIAQATGDIFFWLNADDYMEAGSLHAIAKEFMKNDIDVLCVRSRIFSDSTNKIIAISQLRFFPCLEKTIVESGMNAALFYKLDKIKSLPKLHESLHYAMDFDLWFKYLFAFGTKKIKYSNYKIITHFRMHDTSKSVSLKEHFINDTNALHYSILNQAQAPSFLINFYESPRNDKYQTVWDFSLINIPLLLAYYARKLSIQYYTVHNYKDCRKCLRFAQKNGLALDYHSIVRYLKISILPLPLLNFIRKIKKL